AAIRGVPGTADPARPAHSWASRAATGYLPVRRSWLACGRGGRGIGADLELETLSHPRHDRVPAARAAQLFGQCGGARLFAMREENLPRRGQRAEPAQELAAVG